MASPPTIEDLLSRNREYAATKWQPLPHLLPEFQSETKSDASQVLIIACLDSRCSPYEVLGVKPPECLVIRNASGRFASAAISIPPLDCLINVTQLIILHHNDCASSFRTKDQVIADIHAKRPELSEAELQEIKTRLPTRADNEIALIEDMKAARECSFIRKDLAENVVGLYLDVDTGLVKQVHV